jgi:uncharacterized protein (DUF1778 family)
MKSTRSETTKNDRLELRLPSQKKQLLARAATVRGQTVSEFVTLSALKRARKILANEETLILPEEDREVFFEALESPPEPKNDLKKAFARHMLVVKPLKSPRP